MNAPANPNPWGPQFQQLYTSSAFPAPVTINSIGFDYSSGNTSMQPAIYTLSLATTTSPIFSGPPGPASYITGSNTTAVYTGPGVPDVGGVFTFNLSNDFTYNPASGNLLLTVTATPVTTAAAALFLKGQQFSQPTMSEMYGTNAGVMAFNNGLVTNFGVGQGDNSQGDNNNQGENSQGSNNQGSADLAAAALAAADPADPVAAPLPAALPLFATGLGALGLLGWRRKRQCFKHDAGPTI